MRPFKPIFIFEALINLIPYLGVTLSIMFGTVFFGSLFGAAIASAKIKKKKGLKQLAEVYTLVLRCTPPIVLLFIVFYGLPEFMNNSFGININNINKGIFVTITLTLLFTATISEVMRTAYESIDRGQYEAGASVGMTELQIFRRIMLPQCIVVMLPNFCNSLVSLMKEGALAYTIGFIDLMGKGQLIIGNHYGAYALETYIALALIYWGMTILIEKIFALCEARLSRGKKI
ncbi:amino acid ABC transporter permease [Clostridium sp. Marseille-P299]|uniref:amino acid ABC transporter permease n=1 Tax=Clostridium sp. Marseille-P299 TaxID=1805477 RepID=UPI00082C5820|nr:ABC transporter permease subunit [Clostridium sp. Marseille-P299]